MTKEILLLGLCTFASWGQVGRPIPIDFDPYAEIRQFLTITNDQYARLVDINLKYARLVQLKQERASEVELEIDQEIAKPQLSATALGVRYMELEVICREVRAAAAAIPASSLAVLNDAQKLKLKQLDDAMKLSPTTAQAQSLGLLPGGSPGGGSFATFLIGSVGRFAFAPTTPGCRTSTTQGTFALAPTSVPAR